MRILCRRFKQLLQDPHGILLWGLNESLLNLGLVFSSLFCYVSAWFWGIRLGRENRFFGQCHFLRYPFSTIEIGSRNKFRSSFRSNFIGLNHPCAISSHSKKARVHIGNHCGLSGTSISAYEQVSLGDYVLCGANTTITDFDWHHFPIRPGQGESPLPSAPVVIENCVWLGMNCIVLKGVHIGKNTVVGANSVVTHSLPSDVIAAGSPAVVIRTIANSSNLLIPDNWMFDQE